MGTPAIYRRFNDLGGKLSVMTKEELDGIDNMSPRGAEAGKHLNDLEWTVLERFLLAEIEALDKEFKRSRRKKAKNMK